MPYFRTCLALALVPLLAADIACAQSSGGQQPAPGSMDMPGMKMPSQGHEHTPSTLVETIEQHADSGTSVEPASSPHPMLMTMTGGWMWMLHAVAFLNVEQQTGPRGADKFFSTNWVMGMAQHNLGPGKLTLRAMLSLEPATVSERRYPELFQQGETAFGRPLVDGQHPHDLFMELAGIYDLRLGEHSRLSFYAAPVGDPAMGPSAYPHRDSAGEDPIAPLGHHLEDSTHIASDVLTAGLTYRSVRLEASGFHGREPDEQRWDIDQGKLDSWSARLTVNPAPDWSLQASLAYLTSPEALDSTQDVLRSTASVMYNRPLARGNWATTLLWGRNRTRGSSPHVYNGYLLESTVRFAHANYLWGRIENVDRTSELLLDGAPPPPAFQEQPLARVQAYTFGYARDLPLLSHVATALGAQLTLYSAPAFLDPLYGAHPAGVLVFFRIRPQSEQQ